MAIELAHAVVYVTDMSQMVDFYTQTLGFKVAARGPLGQEPTEIVFLTKNPLHHHQLAFMNTRKDAGPSNSLNHLAFRVDSLDDVKTALRAVTEDPSASGVKPVTHGNAWSVYFKDPEGNGVEIFCDSPFHVQQPQAKGWDPQMDIQPLTSWTKETFESENEFGPIEKFYEQQTQNE